MTSTIAVSAKGLGKLYHLSGAAYNVRGLLSERVERFLRAPFSLAARKLGYASQKSATSHARPTEVWALKDVSFEVRTGEVVGLIGSNGAGKSTLLKVLSRVVAPTCGEAHIRGRVGSLLEVGAGFHPELTGHENIFLNGALIGMSRVEIRSKYDEIVEFSGIEQFLSTPVKYYSSGMFVRLAFSIAANLETDILFLDEVLSVGDVEFQNKSRRKMQDILRSGRTIFLVSHDSAAVRSYCTRAIWLKDGKIVEDGPVESTVSDYVDNVLVSENIALGERIWADSTKAPGTEVAHLAAVRITRDGRVAQSVSSDEEICLEIEYEVHTAGAVLNASFAIFDSSDYGLFTSNNFRGACEPKGNLNGYAHPVGRHVARCWIPARLLNAGEFTFYVNVIHNYVAVAEAYRCLRVIVTDGPSMRAEYVGVWPYPLRPKLTWGTYPG